MASRVLHVGALAVLVVALGGGGVHARVPTLPVLWASADGVGRAARPGATVDVARVDLSQSDKYSEIAVVDDRILLFGPTSPSDGPQAANTCYAASVDPSSLVLGDEHAGSCADPALEGRQVLPVFAVDKDLPRVGVAQAWSCA